MKSAQRVLLDQSAPLRLRRHLAQHEVHSASDLGWSGLEDSEFLKAAGEQGFSVVITSNTEPCQGNLSCGIRVIVVREKSWEKIKPCIPDIESAIASNGTDPVVTVPHP